jgi:alanine racemase
MWQYDRVRTGALLFGVRPMGSGDMDFECRETLCMKTVVAQVTDVAAGETVGYDSDSRLSRDSRVATLCAGYGDGYPRCMSKVASVMIRGRLAPVLGLVCMDQMMVDVTEIPGVCEGDEVTLLGGGISYMQYAAWARTNRNEAITIVSRRPLRVYMKNGKVEKVVDYLSQEGGMMLWTMIM